MLVERSAYLVAYRVQVIRLRNRFKIGQLFNPVWIGTHECSMNQPITTGVRGTFPVTLILFPQNHVHDGHL